MSTTFQDELTKVQRACLAKYNDEFKPVVRLACLATAVAIIATTNLTQSFWLGLSSGVAFFIGSSLAARRLRVHTYAHFAINSSSSAFKDFIEKQKDIPLCLGSVPTLMERFEQLILK